MQQSLDRLTTNQFIFQGLSVSYVSGGTGDPVIFIHNEGTSHMSSLWTCLGLEDQPCLKTDLTYRNM